MFTNLSIDKQIIEYKVKLDIIYLFFDMLQEILI